MSDHYTSKPENRPLLPDGSPLSGGPWVLAGEGKPDRAYHTDHNNGVMAVCTAKDPQDIDSSYVVHVAPASTLNHHVVADAHFSHGLGVPYSNGENSKTADVEAFRTHSLAMRKVEDRHGHEGWTVNLMDVTERQYKRPGTEETCSIDKVTDGTLLGTCNVSPTGVFAYVNSEGHTMISLKNAQDLLERFKAVGIPQNEALQVPFARGETPIESKPHDFERVEEKVRGFQQSAGYMQKMLALKKASVIER